MVTVFTLTWALSGFLGRLFFLFLGFPEPLGERRKPDFLVDSLGEGLVVHLRHFQKVFNTHPNQLVDRGREVRGSCVLGSMPVMAVHEIHVIGYDDGLLQVPSLGCKEGPNLVGVQFLLGMLDALGRNGRFPDLHPIFLLKPLQEPGHIG